MYSRLKRILIRHSRDPRPSSWPYISGDSFRSISNHILDSLSVIDPEKVKSNDILFVQTDMLEDFFNKIHPDIQYPYILISHNSDKLVDESLTKFADDKIIHWFSQNVGVPHVKITPIPIGLENLHHYKWGVPSRFSAIKRKTVKKIIRIVFGFNVDTNVDKRLPALNSLKLNPNADQIKGSLSETKYLDRINNYSFVASPQGNGIDCHRTWESIYLGSVPIVERSYMTEYFVSIGLPLFLIDNWEDLNNMTEADLKSVYDVIKQKANPEAIWMEYWYNLIKEKISHA